MMAASDLDLDRVPAALRELPQWLVWRFEQHEGDKKPRKVPYYATGGKRMGKQGDDADRARLVPFDVAVAAMERGGHSGLGFAFLPGDGLIGIDLDGVIDPETGEVQERAAGIIKACASFTELSPSGKGVHIYVRGDTKSNKSNDIGVEVFCGRQFFTVTGRQFPGAVDAVEQIRPDVLARLHAVIDEAKGARRTASHSPERQPVVGGGEVSPVAKVESALAFISPDVGYVDWLRIGMAIHAELGQNGFGSWDWWSAKGSKYPGTEQVRRHWDSFKGGSITGASLFKLAIDAGWRAPRLPRPAPAQSAPSGASEAGESIPANLEPPEWLNEAPPMDALMDAVHDAADWISDFRRSDNGKGNITPTLFNTLNVLENDPAWRGVLAFNQFSYRITKRRAPPTQSQTAGEWVDIDDVRLQVYLTKAYSFEPKKATVMDAVMEVAHAHPFHPVREWLRGIQWDGKRRLHRLLGDYFGCASTPSTAPLRAEDPEAFLRLDRYLELASVKWLVGAVARIMRPGCKLDTMIVLEGGQGVFKSSSIRLLFGDEWFSDSKLTIGDKDALAQMQGKWCYEMSEMDAHRKADDTAFKQFLSSQVDRVRWHYGKRAEDVPRQCIFVGTTNMDHYGKDETGMRRVWPAVVGKVDMTAIEADREQIFAEARDLFERGTTWWVSRDVTVLEPCNDPVSRAYTEWELFDEQAEQRQNLDAWEAPIVEWIEKNNKLAYITTAQVMGDALLLDIARWTPPEQKRVNAILRRLGWKPKKVGPKHARRAGWVRAAGEDGQAEGGESVPV